MENKISSSFIYAILGGIFSVLALLYYERQKDPKKSRHPLYHAGVFFIVSNIIYNFTSPDSVGSQMVMSTPFNPVVCEMQTGQPPF